MRCRASETANRLWCFVADKATWVGVIVAVVTGLTGAVSGLWGAYTAHEALQLKQPLDEHTEMVKSYLGQIDSAKSRKDWSTVTRLRIEYENYEEKWRTVKTVASIVKPITELQTATLSPAATRALTDLIAQLSTTPAVADSAPATMGAAYLALDRYDSALHEFSSAGAAPKNLALKAAAWGGLASATSDVQLKQRYSDAALSTLKESIRTSRGSDEQEAIIQFARNTPGLIEVVPYTADKKPNK
jgi:hypothetical protein